MHDVIQAAIEERIRRTVRGKLEEVVRREILPGGLVLLGHPKVGDGPKSSETVRWILEKFDTAYREAMVDLLTEKLQDVPKIRP